MKTIAAAVVLIATVLFFFTSIAVFNVADARLMRARELEQRNLYGCEPAGLFDLRPRQRQRSK